MPKCIWFNFQETSLILCMVEKGLNGWIIVYQEGHFQSTSFVISKSGKLLIFCWLLGKRFENLIAPDLTVYFFLLV